MCAAALPDAPAQLEATVRHTGQAAYLFLLNHSDTEPATVTLPGPGVDLLTGAPAPDPLTLGPAGVAVIRWAVTY